MYKRIDKDETGVVSIITVIFISVILTVLTTSFIRLTINEQRESTDDDLTTRAYYAAESGVQDAVAALKTGAVVNGTECAPETNGILSDASELDTGYTCQTINELPSDFQASLDIGESVQFKLRSASLPIEAVIVKWHIKGDAPVEIRSSSVDLPRDTEWSNAGTSFPAMLRTQISSVNVGSINGSLDRDAFGTYVGFLNPVSSGGGTVATLSGLNGLINNSTCNAGANSGEYVCSLNINGLNDAASDYTLRLQALYNSTDVQVIALSNAGDPNSIVGLIGAQVIIDVTGRASDVYRRVEERVARNTFDLWPDYAILSAEDLCKNFAITDLATGGNASNVNFAEANTGSIVGSCVN